MSATGLEVFDKTLQMTNIWLEEIERHTGPDRRVAWHCLQAVLRTLRDRLPPELAAHLGAQLPLLVRGAYYDQYEPTTVPTKTRTLDAFLEDVTEKLDGIRPGDPQLALKGVCAVLDHHVSPGQKEKVYHALPEDIRSAVTQ